MKKVIVITGTPATGKTTVSEKLAKALKNSQLIKANDIVKKKRLFTSYAKDGSMIVKMGPLHKELARIIGSSRADFVIVEGHLLCDMKLRGATAVVIREHLKTIRERMRKRGYAEHKINDNIVAEATNYCGIRSAANYRDVYEFFSKDAAAKIASIARGKRVRKESIELLEELNQYLGNGAI